MKVIIIEDEKLSAEHLQNMLAKTDVTIEVTANFDSVKNSIIAFENGLSADILFLDIHLADGISFEILEKVNIVIPIIFTTAYNEYAIKAFKHNSIDYLLKPIGITELQAAITKFQQQQFTAQSTLLKNMQATFSLLNKQFKTRFLVKQGAAIDSIPAADVHHFQTQESITFLVTKIGKRYPIDYTLDDLVDLLDPVYFFRINRKIILHINVIQKVNTYFNSRLQISTQFIEGDSAVVSRERVIEFKQWLDK
jgi:DNA-binding LytR/AlgR family response regulator